MSKNNKVAALLLAALLVPGFAFAQSIGMENETHSLGRSNAGTLEVHATAWTQLALKGADKDLGAKIAAQITANPANAEALVSALVAANPEHAAAIVRAAMVTLPSRSVAITVATLTALHDNSKTNAIITAALRVAPRDSKTVSDLQSLVTRNWTPQNNTQPNFNNPANQKEQGNNENNNSPLPREQPVGGSASPT